MNKIQDGFVALGDSYQPMTVSSNRAEYARISFVGDTIVVRAIGAAKIELLNESDDGLTFKLTDGAIERPAADSRAQADHKIKGNM